MERNYRDRAIEAAFAKMREIDREDALEKVVREEKEKRVKLVIQFDPRFPSISNIIKRSWNVMVQDDVRLLEVPEYKKEPRCTMCPHTTTRPGELKKEAKISRTGESFKIKNSLSCKSKNILYLEGHNAEKQSRACPDKPQYLGETMQSAQQRCREHKGTITFPCHEETKAPVGRHYRDTPGHTVADFTFLPIEKIRSSDPFVRKSRERMYINRFQMIQKGLNINL